MRDPTVPESRKENHDDRTKEIPPLLIATCAILAAITSVAPAEASSVSVPDNQLSESQSKEIESNLEKGFRELFTKVIVEDSDGIWKVSDRNPLTRAQTGLTDDELQLIADRLNSGASGYTSFYSWDNRKYAECIVSNAIGLPLPPSAADQIIQQARDHHWKDMAKTIIRSWGEASATDLLQYGGKAAIASVTNSNPILLASKLALYAGTCAIWGHGD